MVTITVAVSLPHGETPFTVYVYVPAASTSGSNIPVPLGNAGDQVPPGCAEVPSNPNKSIAGSVVQIFNTASLPAFGGGMIETVTVAVSFGHGDVPATV